MHVSGSFLTDIHRLGIYVPKMGTVAIMDPDLDWNQSPVQCSHRVWSRIMSPCPAMYIRHERMRNLLLVAHPYGFVQRNWIAVTEFVCSDPSIANIFQNEMKSQCLSHNTRRAALQLYFSPCRFLTCLRQFNGC